ncbi:MAG: hypothetical protein FWC40_08525 [Proteobacteria bacterium]|nr:hypothetical protein [Pseudomonadota bacterium]
MLNVVGVFITLQPGLCLVALATAMLAGGLGVAMVCRARGGCRHRHWLTALGVLAFFVLQGVVLHHWVGVDLVRVEFVRSLSHPKS